MKKLGLLISLALLCLNGLAQKNKLKDGFYEVYQLGNDSIVIKENTQSILVLRYNSHFKEDAPKEFNRVAIYTSEFVPLELEKQPEVLTKKGLNSKLLITLSPQASSQLKGFTEKRIMKKVAIVMAGEVLTVHNIKTVITGPGMEISRCNDMACEKLQIMMKEKVKQ